EALDAAPGARRGGAHGPRLPSPKYGTLPPPTRLLQSQRRASPRQIQRLLRSDSYRRVESAGSANDVTVCRRFCPVNSGAGLGFLVVTALERQQPLGPEHHQHHQHEPEDEESVALQVAEDLGQ